MPGDPKPIAIYVDADACPVKAEVGIFPSLPEITLAL
jgi:uncharacterized protein YaiI (UPF0178 family)